MQSANLNLFIKHSLTSILREGSTLINFGFLIKEDLMCSFNFRLYRLEHLQYFHSYTKLELNLTNFLELIKFEIFPDVSQIEKTKHADFIYNYKELFRLKFKFRETCSGNAVFSKNSKFYKV